MEQGLTTNENKELTALKKISQSELSLAIQGAEFSKASNLLPTKIENVFDQPKVFEMVRAIGENSVRHQIEFELVNLASLMSVGGNLNDSQIQFISQALIDLYPSESLADFKICFQRGAIGAYGNIQRMDGITLREWMEKYLEEKYTVMEDLLMKQKDDIYKPVNLSEEEKNHLINVDAMLETYKQTIKGIESKTVRPIGEEEIIEEGQAEPKRPKYIPPTKSEVEKMIRHNAWIRNNFDAYTGEKKADYLPEDEWIKKNFTPLSENI